MLIDTTSIESGKNDQVHNAQHISKDNYCKCLERLTGPS